MSKFWKQIKHQTTMITRVVKEKTQKVERPVDPAYREAVDKYKAMMAKLKELAEIVKNFEKLVIEIPKTASDAVKCLTDISGKLSPEVQQIITKADTCCANLSRNANEIYVPNLDSIVIPPLEETLKKVEELTHHKEKRRKNLLILESNKDKLAQYEAKGKTDKVGAYKLKVQNREEKLQKRTNAFISGINAIWDDRFNTLEKPIQEIMSTLYAFAQDAWKEFDPVKSMIPRDELNQEFEPYQPTATQ